LRPGRHRPMGTGGHRRRTSSGSPNGPSRLHPIGVRNPVR
jgi:hypothetical protein